MGLNLSQADIAIFADRSYSPADNEQAEARFLPTKEIEKYLEQTNVYLTNLKKLFRQTQKTLDKAAQKGVIHRNNAADKKSKYSQKINSLEKEISLGDSAPIE